MSATTDNERCYDAGFNAGYQAGLAKAQQDHDDAYWLRQYAGILLTGLMLRHEIVGYSDKSAIDQSIILANHMVKRMRDFENEIN